MTTLSLYELNNLVRSTLEQVLPDTYWVKAELSEVRTSRGHCYVEFVQKSSRGDSLIAKSRGQIWAGTWAILQPYFERTTGQRLSAGMQVLVCVEVTFHELYGYSLNVVDIDPTFTLGDIARRRQEILRRLEQNGVLNMNKELPLPRLLQRIAVISSATAAGYGDFSRQLADNPRQLHFHTRLFPAIMQGDGVERSVIDALNEIALHLDDWDAVVIIRGGGSTSDLSGFDTLALAENVAQFPLPIITGIGHERDDTVLDLISHTRVKTPTAAAEFLIRHQTAELDNVESLADRIATSTVRLLHDERMRQQRITAKLPSLFSIFRLREENRLQLLTSNVSAATLQRITAQHHSLQITSQRLNSVLTTTLTAAKHHLLRIEDKLQSSSPEHILRLGYSITRIDGKAVTDTAQLKSGDRITTTLHNGEVESIVSIP